MRVIRSVKPMPLVRRFAADGRAVAATELALILPVMLTMYLGSIDVAQMVEVDRKTAQSTRTTADLTSQIKYNPQTKEGCASLDSIPPSAMGGIFKATTAVVAPYSTGPLGVVVTCVAVDKAGSAKVIWSQSSRGTGGRTSIAAPTGLSDGTSTTYWVLAEGSYTFTPTIGYVLTGAFNLSEVVYMRTRF